MARRQATEAIVSLVQLRNCLVNLPPSLTGPLLDSNTPAQNVIVEVQYRPGRGKSVASTQPPPAQSVFLGWTGFPSKARPSLTSAPNSSRDSSFSSSRGPSQGTTVEIDSVFARTLGLEDGTKVELFPHLEPALAHTVHIEPLTPADWDIIELHAMFLEANLQLQIRALPNPAFVAANAQSKDKTESQTQTAHPLTIHLSPTSTANVIVTQLTPPVPKDVAFAKLSPDAEVIVAPKTRAKVGARVGKGDSRSVMSGSVRSGRTSATARQRSAKAEAKKPIFVRGTDIGICPGLVEDAGDFNEQQKELQIWVDSQLLASSKNLRGQDTVVVSVVRPAGLQPPMDAQAMQRLKEFESTDAGLGAVKVVARMNAWNDAPSQSCAAMSSHLCETLGVKDTAGSLIRLEPVPGAAAGVKIMKVFPFASSGSKQTEGLKFGGETRASRESAGQRLMTVFGSKGKHNLFNGPLTDGLILPKAGSTAEALGWNGGIVRFQGNQSGNEGDKSTLAWFLSKEDNIQIEVQAEIPSTLEFRTNGGAGEEPMSSKLNPLIGLDAVVSALIDHSRHGSSMLLTGGLGSGKTLVAQHLAHQLRSEYLYHVAYFPCRKLVTDETRVSAVKDTFNRLFMQASWGARLGGKALVILDDIDRLCPSEQELQVGNDNARARQISELLCATVKQYCGAKTGVVLLATAQGKESLHDTVVGGHILPETVDLKAPNKLQRRQILESLVSQDQEEAENNRADAAATKLTANGTADSQINGSWMDNSAPSSRPASSYQNDIVERGEAKLDLLETAGQTDGYMPGDLHLLFSRAKSESLIRTIADASPTASLRLTQKDFEEALDGFTPASLRNVTLQTSSTTFASIGGLKETRKILLETLQYPTTYAPIFAQCPLRLRSGLLLYGYPGCGKTMLASAVAGECGLNFISVKGPEILNKYIGASEKSVRDLFERAQAAAPAVLFFDEFDAVAPKRGHDSTGVTDRVVNQLLTQMDGAEGLTGVYVLAATSRPDLIDPALLRPGRLDKSLLCDMPSEEDRLDILRALSKTLKISPSIADGPHHSPHSLHEVARRTQGYSGADLQALVYNAHLEAIHDVLDEQELKPPPAGANKPTKAMATSRRMSSSSNAQHGHSHELIQFRYGVEEDRKAAAALTGPKAASERAILLAKLEAQRIAKRKEREARRGTNGALGSSQLLTNGADGKDAKEEDVEVTIGWKHIEKSLGSTRSSISAKERLKLQAIYNEFVQGRNGEMPNGQGSMEVGARSSLA